MKNFKQALLVMCISVSLSASLKADSLLGKQLSGIDNSILNESIINRQNNIITNRITEIKKKTEDQNNVNKLLTALPDGEVSTLILPVGNLTEPLNIVDNAGKTVFRDVEVENGWRVIEQQWLVMSTQAELITLQQLAQNNIIELINTQSFNDLGLTLAQFTVNKSIDSAEKISEILPSSLQKKLTRDYVYQTQLSDDNKITDQSISKHKAKVKPLSHAACLAPLSIGMVDTAIDNKHPVFKG